MNRFRLRPIHVVTLATLLAIISICGPATHTAAATQNAICGDVNDDGMINLTDFVGIMAFITDRSNAADSALCDVDGCEGVTINDGVYIAEYIYSEGPDPICETVSCETSTGIELTAGEVLFAFDNSQDTGYVEFSINVANTTGLPVSGATIGLVISSPTGVTARDLIPIKENTVWEQSHTHVLTDDYSDTAGIVTAMFAPQYWIGATGVAARLYVKTGALEAGEIICIDSCSFPPAGQWLWSLDNPGSDLYTPSWGGPYCFTVPEWCCSAFRGNIDNDPDDALDISDLVYLTDYMFAGGPAPECFPEADVDASGGEPLDVTDLITLVEFMFNSGPQPPDCPVGVGTLTTAAY